MTTSPAVHIPTRAEARRKRAAEQRGFLFDLHRTGGQAHVRALTLADASAIAGLPAEQRAVVFRVFAEIREDSERADGGDEAATLERDQRRQLELANAVCIAGFIKPRLVRTEAELDPADDYCWLVDDLHVEERVRFLNISLGADAEAAKAMQPFPEPGVGGLDAGEALPPPPTAFFPPADGGIGLLG